MKSFLKSVFFKNFHDLLWYLFLGTVYNGATGELEDSVSEAI